MNWKGENMQITAIILAGGKSSRMGQDKGLLFHHGKRMVEHMIDACKQITFNILISTNNAEYKVFGYPLIADNYKEIGPIGGIQAALAATETEDNIFCPCDMPEIQPPILNQILQKRENNRAVVATERSGKLFPVLGYYRKSALNIVESQIEKGNYKLEDLIFALAAEKVIVSDEQILSNINYPEDLK